MLGILRSHMALQKYMIERVNRDFKHNPKSIEVFESDILKMYHLNLARVSQLSEKKCCNA